MGDRHIMESSFPSFTETFYQLFWDLFGYGEIQTTAIFLPNLRYPKETADSVDEFLEPDKMLKYREKLCAPNMSRNKSAFIAIMAELGYSAEDVEKDFNFAPHIPFSAEWIGTIFLSIYHVFAVIVMLNMLIALMTTVFNRMGQLAYIQWKATKARLRLRHIVLGFVVESPMNLPTYVLRLGKWLWDAFCGKTLERKKDADENDDDDVEKKKEKKKKKKKRLIQDRLHRRYINLVEIQRRGRAQ